jgi:hypothetical protein
MVVMMKAHEISGPPALVEGHFMDRGITVQTELPSMLADDQGRRWGTNTKVVGHQWGTASIQVPHPFIY